MSAGIRGLDARQSLSLNSKLRMFFSRSLRGWLESLVILILGSYVIYGAFDVRRLWLIDGANLLFHEAGHLIFGILGEVAGFWGGTWMQLLMPLGIAVAFYRQGQKYSSSVMALWLGENFFGISVYIKDARSQNLPLVGGEIHDWGYLLGKAGLLQYDQMIGNMAWFGGAVIVLGSIFAGLVFSEAKQHDAR